MSMKFDKATGIDRGLCFTLRDDEGSAWGSITSCFVSSRGGSFSRNYANGFLIMSAQVYNMHAKVDTPEHLKTQKVLEATSSGAKRRVDADRLFREWIKTENLREKLIEQAELLRAQWLEHVGKSTAD